MLGIQIFFDCKLFLDGKSERFQNERGKWESISGKFGQGCGSKQCDAEHSVQNAYHTLHDTGRLFLFRFLFWHLRSSDLVTDIIGIAVSICAILS